MSEKELRKREVMRMTAKEALEGVLTIVAGLVLCLAARFGSDAFCNALYRFCSGLRKKRSKT